MSLFVEILPFFAIFALGVAFCLVLQWFIKRKALSIQNSKAGKASRENSADFQNELLTVFAEASDLFQAGKADGKEGLELAKSILPQLAFKHPSLAIKLAGKMGKGKLI